MRKILWGLAVLTVLTVVGAWAFLRSLGPDYTEDLRTEGLGSDVLIRRNAQAVPSIEAATLEDFYFAWGYVNAQDRMFQIEMTRRIGQGRLSELLGPSMLPKDIFLRAMGFHDLSRREAASLKPENLKLLQRFVDGVNFFQENHRKPFAMTLLGVEPESWTPADPLLVGMMLNWVLAYNMKHELLYTRMAGRLGKDKASELLALLPEGTPTVIPGGDPEAERRLSALFQDFGDLLGGRSASNAWVVGPGRSSLKGPILASDPHVHGSKIPSDFYLVSGKAGDLRLTGGHPAGLPFIAFGYNNAAAWGVTNQGADVVDLYFETIDWKRKTWRWGEEDRPLGEKQVEIPVKGQPPVRKTLYYAGRRPLLNDVFQDLGRDVSLDWAGFETLGADGFFELNRALTFEAWEAACKKIGMTPQNMVYADRTGRIAYRVIGLLVNRAQGTGNFPCEAAQGRQTWNGLLDPDLYPAWTDPQRGWIATSNNKVVEDFVCDMNAVYAPRYRYEAITRMLEGEGPMDIAAMKRMQTDLRSGLAPVIVPLMKRLVRPTNEKEKGLLERVIRWDGAVRAEDPAPAIYNTWLVRFMMQTFTDELGEDLATEYVSERYISLERFLDLLEKDSPFFDDQRTPERETPSDIATRAMTETCGMLARVTGKEDPSSWTWGEVHHLCFEHPLGKDARLKRWVNPPSVPLAGDGETNLRAHFYEVAPPYTAFLASGIRLVVGFDPEPRGQMVLITGENEWFLGEHYRDLTDLWLSGDYMDMEHQAFRYETRLRAGK